MDILDRLQSGLMCGDGAMGTFLLNGGLSLDRCFEELCLSAPDRIRDIHARYVSAGANVIKTNSFGANAVRLARFRFQGRVDEINRAAARVARGAAEGTEVFVAGSVGPLGILAKEAAALGIDRAACFREQIAALVDAVDVIFFETFSDADELVLALAVKEEMSDAPAICSFACAPDGRLQSGISVAQALAKLRDAGAKMVGLNCLNGPRTAVQLLDQLSDAEQLLAIYPSAGAPRTAAGRLVYDQTPEDFALNVPAMVARGARLIGGCCGTTPEHVRAIADALTKLRSRAEFRRANGAS